MSDEVKRLCNLIIGHVADGKTIFEKDHAAMIDTMRSQQAEIERLREAAKRLLDNYGFCSDGSDHYREVPVEDIESLIAALGATR